MEGLHLALKYVVDNFLLRGTKIGDKSDAWESHLALPLEGSREAYNPHQAVYLIVVV